MFPDSVLGSGESEWRATNCHPVGLVKRSVPHVTPLNAVIHGSSIYDTPMPPTSPFHNHGASLGPSPLKFRVGITYAEHSEHRHSWMRLGHATHQHPHFPVGRFPRGKGSDRMNRPDRTWPGESRLSSAVMNPDQPISSGVVRTSPPMRSHVLSSVPFLARDCHDDSVIAPLALTKDSTALFRLSSHRSTGSSTRLKTIAPLSTRGQC
jgi:hypothetical protein